jgi:Dpy-30 motif
MQVETAEVGTDENYAAWAKAELPVPALPLREYFDTQIYPHLAPALALVAKERPANPIEFLAGHLLNLSPSVNATRKSTEDPKPSSN